MDDVKTWAAKLAPYAPAFAGSVLSLMFIENLTIRGRILAVIVGLCAASFLAPALAEFADLFWPGTLPDRVRDGVSFMTGLSAMGVLPPFLAWLKKFMGDPFRLVKVKWGPVSIGEDQ